MRQPRMTTRRWMLTTGAVGGGMACYAQAERWHLRSRYLTALREHSAYARFYGEGRVTVGKYLEKSEDLMKVQIALCPSKRDRAAFVSAHLERAAAAVKEE